MRSVDNADVAWVIGILVFLAALVGVSNALHKPEREPQSPPAFFWP